MNGATAVPLVSTMRPPKNASTIKIGSNQNFLRVRRNAQNSRRNETIIKTQNWFLRVSGGGPGGWRDIQYVSASGSNRRRRMSLPARRMIQPTGVMQRKKMS